MSERLLSQQEFDDFVPFENPLGRNDRFTYAKVRMGGEWFFRKEAKMPELIDNLQREILWSEYIAAIADQAEHATITAPKIFGFDNKGALLTEFIDAPLVCPPDKSSSWVRQLGRYADMLVVLDEHSQNGELAWPDSSKLNGTQDIDKVWSKWLGQYAEKVPDLRRARDYIEAQVSILTFCVQHGDLTPWQIFNRNGVWVIFDGEKSGDHLPRFNDLCYAYGRLYTRFHEHKSARELLRLFITKTSLGAASLEPQLLPVMLFRAVGMIGDAVNDNNARSLKDALDLYERCLSGDITKLIAA